MAKTEIIKLNMLGLPVIQSLDDFSEQTHISKYTIYQLSYYSNKQYKIYSIPKKTGGVRRISQPSRKLKAIQSWILVTILNKLQVSDSCKGFKLGSSTLENAKPHIGAAIVINLDIKEFFSTVTDLQVFNIFKTIGYNNLISTVFTKICTFEGKLPQGSPCSPYLANLSAWNLDLRIQGFVGKRGICYTRYADDLSFSGLNPPKVVKIIPIIKRIIEEENFTINNKKTRITGPARAKIVTGLIVNEDRVGIGKQKYKDLRAKIHYLTLPNEQTNTSLLNEVRGWLSYLYSVDQIRYSKAIKYLMVLKIKHPLTLISKIEISNQLNQTSAKLN